MSHYYVVTSRNKIFFDVNKILLPGLARKRASLPTFGKVLCYQTTSAAGLATYASQLPMCVIFVAITVCLTVTSVSNRVISYPLQKSHA